MKLKVLLRKIRNGARKPPKIIIKRVSQEIADYFERFLAPQRAKRLTLFQLLKTTNHPNLKQLWSSLSNRPYFTYTTHVQSSLFETFCPGDAQIIFARATLAIEHKVDLLGSGLVELGEYIDWQKDFKSNYDWPQDFIRDIDYNNPERPSDVKFPWEVSRLQWLIPAGQAYLLTQDERYAQSVKDILLDWIKKNPYSYGINWACTMEVALRILSWTWFFHVFKNSKAWQDESFQQQFLTCLYLHADFTERHLEFSDVNGNHYTADAAGLVFAGLFFGAGISPERWQNLGWSILCNELPRQIFSDGVDFEASVPYHRLVLELFFLPACYRESQGLETPKTYIDRLSLMAQFSIAYTQPEGAVPFWGDADDARALPFGSQNINDHRYLSGLVLYKWRSQSLTAHPTSSFSECFWIFGTDGVNYLQESRLSYQPVSCAFPAGGYYIMQNSSDHVFIDCGPLGLAGRGGHGHNDCLAFEAVLKGVKIISDCGAYVYTASYTDRNLFRSTKYHNTPYVDNQEINRFIQWDYLWTMHNDAAPSVELWQPGIDRDIFCGSHTGYMRLNDPVIPKRTIILDHQQHCLSIQDEIICDGSHEVNIPLHLALNVTATTTNDAHTLLICAGEHTFKLVWEGGHEWQAKVIPARISPSYGVVIASEKIEWYACISKTSKLKILIMPNG